MRVPKEIADMALEYQDAKKKADELWEAVSEWLYENTEADGVYIDNIFISDEPTGSLQNGDEYCDQHCGYLEDDFYGNYYHPVEGEKYYLGYSYQT